MEQNTLEADLVVVGAGGCGLTASLAAAEMGKKVILFERGADAGGTTAMSVGIIIAAGSRLQQANGEIGTADELAADILKKNSYQSSADLTKELCRASGPLVDWLELHGVPLEHMAGYRYPGMSRSWMLSPPDRRGNKMTEALQRKIGENPRVELRMETRVTKLLVEDQTVVGVKAKSRDGSQLVARAKAVILAASGFGANAEMIKTYLPKEAAMPYFGSPFADGAAISWGRELGAVLDHMEAYQAHSSISHPEMMLVTTYLINHGAIQINHLGERFSDETDAYAAHAAAIQAQPGGVVVELFDHHIFHQTRSDFPRFQECIDAGIVSEAETVDEFAQIFELPAAAVEETVKKYNKAAASGRDEFGRSRFGRPLVPPFYGIQVTSALVQTLGGLRVDSRARVLRPGGEPIPGLYAGGGSAAGLAGNNVEGYLAGSGLLAAFGLGWIAGRAAGRS